MERRWLWNNPVTYLGHLSSLTQQRIQLTKILDNYGFNYQVWLVASTGFLTDSYNLFATNVILPSLAFLYWPNNTRTINESKINIITLTGSIVGQLLFGIIADKLGRQRLYGIELIIVLVTTLGLAQSSYGYAIYDTDGAIISTSMDIFKWVLFYRFTMGIGIGAEYPLSSVITAEWASTRSRARMLASVFIMQPLGQLMAYIVSIVVLAALRDQYDFNNQDQLEQAIDKHWRWVTGLGALPAAIALIFRLTIPESGRWTLDVRGNPERAIKETQIHYGPLSTTSLDEDLELEDADGLEEDEPEEELDNPAPTTYTKYLINYFWEEGNWRYLAGTSAAWFLLDFAYYGIQIGSPRFLAKLFASQQPVDLTLQAYQSDAVVEDQSIDKILIHNSTRAMIATSIGSIIGSLILIAIIPYVSRRKLLIWSFLGLGILMAIAGGSFLGTFGHKSYGVTLWLFIMIQLFFNLGPNSLTFIIPAEIFPTPIRCTCHGIAAAAGKLASVIVQTILLKAKFGGKSVGDSDSRGMGYLLIIFSASLFLGSLVTWAWIPELQDLQKPPNSRVLPSKSLEVLAEGRLGAQKDGQIIGMRARIKESVLRRRKVEEKDNII